MAEFRISGILYFFLHFVFSTCLALTLGVARFTTSPPEKIVSSNKTIRLNWKYYVDNRIRKFQDNSPLWEYKGDGEGWLKIAFEDGLDGWKWKLSSECPPKFKNPVRVGKESVATLVIVNTTTDDSGLYRCTLNMISGGPIHSDEVQLTITVVPSFLPSHPNKAYQIIEGHNLSISCKASGTPTPEIRWVNVTDGITKNQGHGTVLLHINSIQRFQTGLYECQARNNPNEEWITKQTHVTVFYKPTILIEDFTRNISSWNGKEVTLKCISEGLPTPSIMWHMPNGQQRAAGVMTITTKNSSNYGRYKCEAKNVAGTDEHSIIVTQLFPPGPPNITISEEDIQASSVIVKWTPPGCDGRRSPVIAYKAQINSTKPPLEQNASKTEHKFTGLKRNTRYEVRVSARNIVGYGIASIIIFTTKKKVTGKDERKSAADETNPVVIAGAVGAVVLFLIAAVIAVIILRKRKVFGGGITKSSRSERAPCHNEVDPDNIAHQGAAGRLSGIDDGIPTYAAVDVSKKKKKERESNIPNYATIDKSKKKRPGKIVYAELADFNMSGAAAAATPRPITYTGTEYADISQFQKPDEPEPTYDNFPGRKK